jgi:predicted PurR-regulated permease PerM
MERVNWQRTRDILIVILCIGVLLWAAWGLLIGQFLHVIVLLLLSMAVAFLLDPAVSFLVRWKIHRVPATFIMYLIVLVVLGGFSYLLVFSLIQQVQTFSTTISNYFNALPQQYNTVIKFLEQQGIPPTSITSALQKIQDQATSFAQTTATNVVNVAFVITNTLVDFFIVAVMSFYLTVDGKHIRDGLISIVPTNWMKHVLLFEDAMNRVVGNYIRGQLTLAVIIGLAAGIGSALLGLSGFALIIGVLAFLFETIPMVGPVLAAIPAILISLLLPDPFPRTFWIIIYFVFVQLIESNVLGPRIVGHAVGLHPVASILALIVGAQLFGPFGALLATPLVAATWVVIASLYRSLRGETADEIMAKKRTPWVIRTPSTSFLRTRSKRHRTTVSGNLELEVQGPPDEQEAQPVKYVPTSSSTSSTLKQGSSVQVRRPHIDVMRTNPDPQEAHSGEFEP